MADDIARWLDRLGLGQYAQAFANNGIDIKHKWRHERQREAHKRVGGERG